MNVLPVVPGGRCDRVRLEVALVVIQFSVVLRLCRPERGTIGILPITVQGCALARKTGLPLFEKNFHVRDRLLACCPLAVLDGPRGDDRRSAVEGWAVPDIRPDRIGHRVVWVVIRRGKQKKIRVVATHSQTSIFRLGLDEDAHVLSRAAHVVDVQSDVTEHLLGIDPGLVQRGVVHAGISFYDGVTAIVVRGGGGSVRVVVVLAVVTDNLHQIDLPRTELRRYLLTTKRLRQTNNHA